MSFVFNPYLLVRHVWNGHKPTQHEKKKIKESFKTEENSNFDDSSSDVDATKHVKSGVNHSKGKID